MELIPISLGSVLPAGRSTLLCRFKPRDWVKYTTAELESTRKSLTQVAEMNNELSSEISTMQTRSRKLQAELGWKPAETFDSGIRKTVQWYLDHPDWVRNVQSGAYRDWVQKHYAAPGAGA